MYLCCFCQFLQKKGVKIIGFLYFLKFLFDDVLDGSRDEYFGWMLVHSNFVQPSHIFFFDFAEILIQHIDKFLHIIVKINIFGLVFINDTVKNL